MARKDEFDDPLPDIHPISKWSKQALLGQKRRDTNIRAKVGELFVINSLL